MRSLCINWKKNSITEPVPEALQQTLNAHHDNYWSWQNQGGSDYNGSIKVTFRAAVLDSWETKLRNDLGSLQKQGVVREMAYA